MPIQKAKGIINPRKQEVKDMVQMTDSPDILYSISQVNAITGVPKSTIRFWEKEFKDFLAPLRTAGNQRRYGPQSVEIVKRINNLVNNEGFTLEGARRQLINHIGRSNSPPDKSEAKLNEFAETMSDYLLQKLFERVREEETRR